MNTKARQRFDLLKDEIRQRMHDDHSYIFRKEANFQSYTEDNEQKWKRPKGLKDLISAQNPGSLENKERDLEEIALVKQMKLRRIRTLKQLGDDMGIELSQEATQLQSEGSDEFSEVHIRKGLIPPVTTSQLKSQTAVLLLRQKQVREQHLRLVRRINKGIVDILEIMQTAPEKRSESQAYELSSFLTDRLQFFSHQLFRDDPDFGMSLCERFTLDKCSIQEITEKLQGREHTLEIFDTEVELISSDKIMRFMATNFQKSICILVTPQQRDSNIIALGDNSPKVQIIT